MFASHSLPGIGIGTGTVILTATIAVTPHHLLLLLLPSLVRTRARAHPLLNTHTIVTPVHSLMSVQTDSQTVLQSPAFAFDLPSISYLAVSPHHPQTLCRNSEGWGPLSPFRYDFTPCFLDVWVASVSAFGLIFGVGAVWYLVRKCAPQPVKKDWHFWSKMVWLVPMLPPAKPVC